jgi:phosphatidylglycerophosphatase A
MTLARFVASGGGCGFLPGAPGTWGSLLAAVLGTGLLFASPWALAAGVVVAAAAGYWSIPRAQGDADPGWVVIDEIAGQWLAMMALARPGWGVAAAFAVFRLLDITKPGPIGAIDRRPGRAGVMGDDLAAGAVAACILWAAGQKWPVLHAW